MIEQTEHVLQKLFSQDSLDGVAVEELRQIVNDHPYFTFGQFLLAKKLQLENQGEQEAQLEHAALYFNEPIWMQALLQAGIPVPLQIRERTEEQREDELKPAPDNSLEFSNPLPDDIHPELSETEEKNFPAEAQAKQEEAIFEPYHTVDYFASQGIKISTDIKPDDRLGRQLKSFTEWLKTLKRLPEAQIEAQLDEASQQNIQAIAEHSLEEKEVVTETMAEVLIKQDKPDEAIKIYEKLSLLNPSKRAYFAAKIEQLKEH